MVNFVSLVNPKLINMRRIFFTLLLCFGGNVFSQSITVDNTTNNASDLVNLLLGNSCVTVSNIGISSSQSVAYFNRNGSTFPINEGIILRNGQAIFSQGSYTGANMSSTATGGGSDAFLQNLSNTSSGQTTAITDLSFLQFDFVPISSAFSFDFLFASNEYGQFQCLSNDIFAFELTNLSTGVTTNLAVIPSTITPVSVKTIKNALYNNTCGSSNPNLFSVYNVNNPGASTLNMRGHTVVLNASSAVTPNTSYRLKLVIADYGDSDYDSAVFIGAGSFENNLDLGPDRIICTGDTYTLDTNLDTSYTFDWLLDGSSTGQTGPTYTVTQPGTYTVNITKGSCSLTDTIVFNPLAVNSPSDLYVCGDGSTSYNFNLTTHNETSLGIDNTIYDVFYYDSIANANSNSPIPSSNLNPYSSPGGQTIFIKIFNTQTGQFCDAVYSFDLITTSPVVAGTNITDSICDNAIGQSYNLTNFNLDVLNGQPAGNFSITYYTNQSDAQQGINNIGSSLNIPAGSTSITVWIRMQNISNSNCFDVTNAVITINPLPIVSTLNQIIECNNYTLPTIANGTYYTGPNGTGTQLNPGDIIDLSGTYYILAGPDANGCTNESQFYAHFVDEYEPTLDNCGSFTVPQPDYNIGAFYTAPGGPTGSGTLIPVGTVFTNPSSTTSITQDIYYYADVNGTFCTDRLFVINIHPLPLADDPADVITCDSYTLPALTNGSYYSLSGGPTAAGQVPLSAGNSITTTQTIYVYNENVYTDVNGNSALCITENAVNISIIDTSLFTPQQACGSYTLPAITIGGYYDAPSGGGNPIDPNIPITTSQTVYYYAPTTIIPNCTEANNLNYQITINPKPAVDTIPSGTHCGEFILPIPTNGSYYMLQGGPTVTGQTAIPAGSIIDLTGSNLNPGTYWIYTNPDANGCDNESSFTIDIIPYPVTDEPINRIECLPYSIPTPTNGTVYTAPGGPNGSGTIVTSTQVFTTDNTFYIYNVNPANGCVFDKPFEVYYNGINLPDFQDINICDTYTLPVLTHQPPEPSNSYTIGYFYNSNGVNPVPNGTVFTSANTPVTIYVYAVNSGRFGSTCIEEKSFTITVSDTPVITPQVFDAEECGSYTLPALPTVNYNINYYSSPGGIGLISPANYTYSTPGTYTVYRYATATNNPNCNDEDSFTFTVHPLLDLSLPNGIICVDPVTSQGLTTHTVNTGLNPAIFSANWSLNGTLMGTGVSYTATEPGTYDVEFIKLTPDVGANCNYNPTTVTIDKSSKAVASVYVSGAFEEQIDITVTIEHGFGIYTYQLDNGPIQSGNIFTNVPAGPHTITITDTLNNCGSITVKAYVLNYPRYFTPNGDGYNETWNIKSLADQPESYIYIYDRFGKFLKQIRPATQGWDGTFNGEPLPSTDYWFQVFYKFNGQDQEFKAHFSLKR